MSMSSFRLVFLSLAASLALSACDGGAATVAIGADAKGDIGPKPVCQVDADCPVGAVVCQANRCLEGQCAMVAVPGTCDDDNACTTDDQCLGGKCGSLAKTPCDDGKPCTTDTCEAGKGCSHTPAGGQACDDGNPCTSDDKCLNDVCKAGGVRTCTDDNVCTNDSCDKTLGCVFAPKAGPCNDNNACTDADACKDGKCLPGTATTCDDANPCTADACAKATGCSHAAKAGPCSDGSLCTEGDSCSGGACLPGAVTVCDDGEDCTMDDCDAALGCVTMPIAGTCTDANPCTQEDLCQSGKCASGAATLCDDGNACTLDSCAPATGCAHTAGGDGVSCGVGATCGGGACKALQVSAPFGPSGAAGFAAAPDGLWISHACRVTRYDATGTAAVNLGSDTTCTVTDGLQAAAYFDHPDSLAVGAGGALYVHDLGAKSIRLVTAGKVSTLAQLSAVPRQFVATAAGKLYATTSACSIVAVDLAGAVTPVWQAATCDANNSVYGLAIDASATTLWVSFDTAARIRKLDLTIAGSQPVEVAGSTPGWLDGPAASAKFDQPKGLAWQSVGVLVIADLGNHRIRRLNLGANATVATLAGNGTAVAGAGDAAQVGFQSPTWVQVFEGAVHVLDQAAGQVRRIQ